MDLRDKVIELVRTRARGRIRQSGGGATYHPPGTRVRRVGEYLALLGGFGYILPAAGSRSIATSGSAGLPEFVAGIDPRLNLAVLAFAPLLAVPFVVASILNERLVAKAALVFIGLFGVAVTWPMREEIYAGSVSGAGPLIGLRAGGWLILVGGSLSLLALRFGQWARQFDDRPRTE